MINTLAYYDMGLIEAVKSFMAQGASEFKMQFSLSCQIYKTFFRHCQSGKIS